MPTSRGWTLRFAERVSWRTCISFVTIVILYSAMDLAVSFIGPVLPDRMLCLWLMCLIIALAVAYAARLPALPMLLVSYACCLATVFGIGWLTDFIPLLAPPYVQWTIVAMISTVFLVTAVADLARNKAEESTVNRQLKRLRDVADARAACRRTETNASQLIGVFQVPWRPLLTATLVFSYASFVLVSAILVWIFPSGVVAYGPEFVLLGLLPAAAESCIEPAEKFFSSDSLRTAIGAAVCWLAFFGIYAPLGLLAVQPSAFLFSFLLAAGTSAGNKFGWAIVLKADEERINEVLLARKGEDFGRHNY